MQTLAMVGASLAGISAARAARAQGFAGRLVIKGRRHRHRHGGIRPDTAGPRGPGYVHTLRTLDDAQDLDCQLVPGTRLVIVGAGFIGAEVTSTARALGAEVTVVCSDTVPLSRPFGREMAADISALHEINGVELICDAAIEPYYSGEGVVSGLRRADGRYLPADVVLVAVGAIPNTEWLAGPGIGLRDGVLCDPMGRTNAPGVVAVGDCAAWLDEESGKHWRLKHWAGAVSWAPSRRGWVMFTPLTATTSPT